MVQGTCYDDMSTYAFPLLASAYNQKRRKKKEENNGGGVEWMSLKEKILEALVLLLF